MKHLFLILLIFNSIFLSAQVTLIPDTNFEQALINQGYDVVLDGQVLTSNISSITSLNVFGMNISNLTGIEDFTALTTLNCYNNLLTSLNLTQNTNINWIDCADNLLTSLDVSQNLNLIDFRCYNNQLTNLDVSQNLNLQNLRCYNNQITGGLNLSLHTSLNFLECQDNLFSCLNVKNGNNSNFIWFDASNNPNLNCIEVDNIAYSTANWTNINIGVIFSQYCNNNCSSSSLCSVNPGFGTTANGNGNYTFTNTSTFNPGSGGTAKWNFGDGTLLDTFSTANPNHTFLANGTFVVVLAQSDTVPGVIPNGYCWEYWVDTVTVTGVPSPLQCLSGFSFYPDTINNNITVVNSSIGNNLTYLWDFGDALGSSTLQNPSYTYAQPGTYQLCLTVDDGAGCINMFCDFIGVNGVVFKQAGFTINVVSPSIITEVENKTLTTDLTIYPNPASTQFTLKGIIQPYNLTIYNSLGQLLYSDNNISDSSKKIDVSQFKSGLFFIRIESEGKVFHSKLLKQ